MMKVILNGWKEGLEKITFTRIQRNVLGKSLKEAKNNVDSLLEGNEIVFEIENDIIALEFYNKIISIGVIGVLENN